MNRIQSHPEMVAEMLRVHPLPVQGGTDRLGAAVSAIATCATICTSCADACLAEPHVQNLARCIRLNLDCAELCATTARVVERMTQADTAVQRDLLRACEAACQVCGAECESHAQMYEHCRLCAEACHHCEQVCGELARSL